MEPTHVAENLIVTAMAVCRALGCLRFFLSKALGALVPALRGNCLVSDHGELIS